MPPFQTAGASDPVAAPEADLGGRWGHDHKDRLRSPDIDEEAEANAERNRGPLPNPTWVPPFEENAPPQDPTVGLCLGTYDVPVGGAFSYERSTPKGAGFTGVPRS